MAYQLTNQTTRLSRTTGLVQGNSDYTAIIGLSILSFPTPPLYQTIFIIKNADTSKYINISSDTVSNFFELELDPGGAYNNGESFAINLNRPFTLAYVRKGNRHFLHRCAGDGQVVQLGGYLTADFSGATFTEVCIGNDGAANGRTNINVSYFKEYSRALTVNELFIEMQASLHSSETNLETDTPIVADLVDVSGNGNDWTVVGTAGSFLDDIPASSIDITGETFPFTRVVTVAEFNVANEIWFKFTSSVAQVLGMVATDISSCDVILYASDGMYNLIDTFDTYPVNTTIGEGDYYIRIFNGSPIASDFNVIFEQLSIVETVPGCSGIISDDSAGRGAIVFNAETGEFTGYVTSIPAGELAAVLPNGISLWHDRFLNFHQEYLVLLDANFDLIASFDTVPSLFNISTAACFANNENNFFVLKRLDGKVWKATSTGVFTDTGITVVPHTGAGKFKSIGVDPLEQVLYWTEGTNAPYKVYRWDLVSNVELPDPFDTGITGSGYVGMTGGNSNNAEILVLPDGKYLVAGRDYDNLFSTLYYVDSDNTLIDFFEFSGTYYIINHIGYTGSNNFAYVWLYDITEAFGLFVTVNLTTGDVVEVLETSLFSQGIFLEDGVFQSIGPSSSCPMVISQYETCEFGPPPPEEPPVIIVTKDEIPPTSAVFTLNAVGMDPIEFTLSHGESRTFSGLIPGTYGITEVATAGYVITYTVSNGDEHDAITVAVGETVTVTVTNTAVGTGGIYKIQPGKRNDTLWTDLALGSTEDVKIPNPKIRTALIGQ